MDEALRAKLETRVARLEQQIKAFKELHASELGLILDELASLRADLVALKPPPESAAASADDHDPAAGSPKRAAWLAEQERRERERQAPLSRRELLRGRDRSEGES
jgi:hypothetical protein